MTEAIIVASIGAITSIVCQIIISNKNKNLTIYRIDQLEKKVEKHNNVIERVYALEKQEAVIEEEIKVANHRIEDLEGFHK